MGNARQFLCESSPAIPANGLVDRKRVRKGDEAAEEVYPPFDIDGKPNQGEFLTVLNPISISFPNDQPSDGSSFPLLRLPNFRQYHCALIESAVADRRCNTPEETM